MDVFELDVQDHVVKLADENIQVSDICQDLILFVLLLFGELLMKTLVLDHVEWILEHKSFKSSYSDMFCKALTTPWVHIFFKSVRVCEERQTRRITWKCSLLKKVTATSTMRKNQTLIVPDSSR